MEFTYDTTMFRSCFEHEFTWINGFSRNVRRFPNSRALTDPLAGRSWTISSSTARPTGWPTACRRMACGQNDVVMYMLYNSPAFVFCYVATQKVGAIGCPINYNFAPGEIAIVLEDSKPKVFLYDAEFAPKVERALELSAWKPAVCVCAGDRYEGYVQDSPTASPRPRSATSTTRCSGCTPPAPPAGPAACR